MKRVVVLLTLLLALPIADVAASSDVTAKAASHSGFPQTVRVRLWYLHPPHELRLRADAGQAQVRKCATCKDSPLTSLIAQATGSSLEIDRSQTSELRISGSYQLTATDSPPIHADFPIELRAEDNHLLVTALMPMEEYIAGVLAGETGNFKSEEA